MRHASLALALTALLLSSAQAAPPRKARPAKAPTPPPTLDVPAATRLLVIAPHPDDEVLGAGGLMQRVHATGGAVRVVYLTDGEGYPEGVMETDHTLSPTVKDYLGYGKQRRREARNALVRLGLADAFQTFLGYPDGGLCKLTRIYWSERRGAFRSPYTRLTRPPKSELLMPAAKYRGENLSQELALIIGDFKPTMIAVPRQEDQHADHCAAWFFLADSLTDVRRVHAEYKTDVINYVIHYYSWPFEDDGPQMDPPPGLRGGASGWMRLALTPAETRNKRQSLRRYSTQMRVMDWFLEGFARSNEVFSRPRPFAVMLPSRRSPCCDR
jgi:LmbE family N-acetylglucosaminyl deacetylase